MRDQTLRLSIDQSGVIEAIYSDDLAGLCELGAATITRASNVEPYAREDWAAGGWAATMANGVVLGPYRLRSEALAAEVAYLEARLFPGVPVASRNSGV